MTSIVGVRLKDGSWRYWVLDYRDGREIKIPAGKSREEAKAEFDKYLIRRNLDKEGYDDQYASDREAPKQ